MIRYSLNGSWEGSGLSPEGKTLSFSGKVPGCVHTDLLHEGIIRDPFWRKQADECVWIEKWSWQYSRTFDAPQTDGAILVFEGLDVYCDVYLNGTLLGRCEDMFVPHSFRPGKALKKKDNELKVVFYSPVALTDGRPRREGCFTTERLYTRRIQCTYYWDWCARFVTCGICGDVWLCYEQETELDNVYFYTKAVDSFGALVAMNAEFSNVGEDSVLDTVWKTPDGKIAAEKTRCIVEPHMYETFDIPNPQLWYPNGYGAQPLYTVTMTIRKNGSVISEKELRFGIRTLRILQIPDEPGTEYYEKCLRIKEGPHVSGANAEWDRNEKFSGFQVIVNGIRIMCKGANWVPCEPFVSDVTDEKLDRIVRLSRDANMNMIRVWGGGVFEKEAFYDACDRYGILVTQDFLMACGDYPDQEEWFRKANGEEARFAALKLRNHTCLAWWSGDNENAVAADDNLPVYPGRRTVREEIEPVIRTLDYSRDFMPSSPYGGIPYGSITSGTTHNTQFMGEKFSYIRDHDMKDYRTYFAKYLGRFVVEEPALGSPMLCSLRRFMNDEDIFGDDTDMWRYHTKNNPAEFFREFEVYDYIEAIAQRILGPFRDSEDRAFKMQYVHYEWIRIVMELFRRNKWFSSGMLFWSLNDCWPSFGGAIIDYYTLPKMAWYSFRRAASGVIASIDEDDDGYSVWICSDTLGAAKGKGILRLVSFDGEPKEWSFEYASPENSSSKVFTVPAEELRDALNRNALLVCDISGTDGSTCRALFMEKSPAYITYPETNVTAEYPGDGRIVLHADEFVHAVVLDGPYIFSDNGFCMLRGETREIMCIPAEGSEEITPASVRDGVRILWYNRK